MTNSLAYILSSLIAVLMVGNCDSQNISNVQNDNQSYTFKKGDPNGIGKWYMGREIAHVMGYQGINWLERDSRESEENTNQLIKNMNIKTDDVIADIGAGSGYHVFRMAPLADSGMVYAVDIQEEMLAAIEKTKLQKKMSNINLVKGSETSISLPENTIDKILLVDVYHEFAAPKEMLASMKQALKSDGKIYLIEYRGEDPTIPIKRVHKMTERQAVKEFKASGFKLATNKKNLPWQHCMIFIKSD